MKSSDSKTRILALERIFQNNKQLTLADISDKLWSQYGITAERKTLYDDIAALTRFLPIRTEKKGHTYFYINEMEQDNETN